MSFFATKLKFSHLGPKLGLSNVDKGPYLNDVYTIIGILNPLFPLVCILARSIVLNATHLPYFVSFEEPPSPLSV